eukprot:2211671-Prorocentrum_lima.AAC.1
MHYAYTRDHFKLSFHGPHLAWQEHFKTGPKSYEGGREWGVLVNISGWLKKRREMIVAAWRPYIHGG